MGYAGPAANFPGGFGFGETRGSVGLHDEKIIHLLTTDEKAKEINFSGKHYGTFAEIGAGQEVARWFFQAGGAAGTVAKSMSAYDMTFSNAIYGTAHRFVSRERLGEMLDHEYRLLLERLGQERGIEAVSLSLPIRWRQGVINSQETERGGWGSGFRRSRIAPLEIW